MISANQRILVTGGGTFLGDHIAAALLAEGTEVTLLVRPGAEARVGWLAQHTRCWTADLWDPASLRGRARGHASVIHTVGSMVADPVQGLTHHRLNFVSARNVINMCVSDGVPHLVLMSGVYAPWISRQYIRTKREAEEYIQRVGVRATIIRAPLVYMPRQPRPLFYQLLTLLGSAPPLSWLWFGRVAPMPIDRLARAVARITLDDNRTKTVYYAPDLRKRISRQEARRPTQSIVERPSPTQPLERYDHEAPFGWTPPDPNKKE